MLSQASLEDRGDRILERIVDCNTPSVKHVLLKPDHLKLTDSTLSGLDQVTKFENDLTVPVYAKLPSGKVLEILPIEQPHGKEAPAQLSVIEYINPELIVTDGAKRNDNTIALNAKDEYDIAIKEFFNGVPYF